MPLTPRQYQRLLRGLAFATTAKLSEGQDEVHVRAYLLGALVAVRFPAAHLPLIAAAAQCKSRAERTPRNPAVPFLLAAEALLLELAADVAQDFGW